MQSFLRIIKPRNTISVFISNPNSLLHTSPTPSPPSAAPTTTQYDELVNEAGRARNLRRVRFLLIQRINDGRFSSKDTFRFITNAQSSIDLIDEVFQCIASLPKGIPRRSALEAFVGRLCKIGLIKDALQVLDKMRQRNLEINAYSFHPVLSALSIKKDTDAAMRVLEGMKAVGTNPDTTAYNYILTAYCSIGDVIKAAELLEGMEGEKGVKAGMRTYDALVLGACRAGKVETGVAIVRVAVDNGVRLIHSTYAHVIKALLDEGYYEQAMKFVMSFAGRDEGVDKENFELLGNGFLKLGRVEDVKRVVGEMVQRETNRQDTDAVPEQRSPATEGGSREKARIFNYRELATATRNFHRKEFLGEGGFGTVYKGILRTGETVAVKRLNPSSLQGEKEFQVEILMLSLLRHPNLVNMIGYCSEGNQRLLVLEFMPLGSLEQHLHDLPLDQEPLDWSTRMNIAAGAARGVDYLHNEADPPVIFRDLKPSNILLDDEGYHPKLSDFGLARFGPVGDQSHVSTRVVGTHGYCAPEYFNTGRLTPKSDTYSFGVVLLEIISGKKAYDQARGTGKTSLVEWARPLLKDPKNYVLFADPKLKGEYSKSRLWRAVQVATMCVNENAKSRPTMHEVASAMDYLVTGTPGFTLSKLGHGPNLSPRISPRSPGKSPLGRSPLSPGESPLRRGKSPLSTERSPLSPRKSPLRLVSPLIRVKSPLSPRKSPLRPEISALSRGKSPLSPGRSPLSPAKSPKISPHDADKEQSLAEAKMWGKELREKIRQGAGSSSNSYSASADSFSSSLDNLAGLIT